jgi:hypothetical protein
MKDQERIHCVFNTSQPVEKPSGLHRTLQRQTTSDYHASWTRYGEKELISSSARYSLPKSNVFTELSLPLVTACQKVLDFCQKKLFFSSPRFRSPKNPPLMLKNARTLQPTKIPVCRGDAFSGQRLGAVRRASEMSSVDPGMQIGPDFSDAPRLQT